MSLGEIDILNFFNDYIGLSGDYFVICPQHQDVVQLSECSPGVMWSISLRESITVFAMSKIKENWKISF